MELQQRLPLAVLKRFINNVRNDPAIRLQQRLPLAVLKQTCMKQLVKKASFMVVATALTACGIETI